MQIIKVIFSLFLGVWGVIGAFNIERFWLLDGANILFHEAGHMFFMFLGETMGIVGGTALQLLFPFGIMIGFVLKGQAFSASVMLWWFGQNGIGIARYIQDSRAQVLNYIGGEIHDWYYLLSKMNLLQFDQQIGNLVWFSALMTMIAASALGVCYSKSK